MASKQTHFFATREDLEPGLRTLEKNPLKYVLCGLFPSESAPAFESLLALESLGRASQGNSTLCDQYLVLPRGAELKIRSVPQRKGGTKYAVDQLANPVSIIFQPGGRFGENALIVGSAGTASEHPESLALLRSFGQAVTRGFKKVRQYLVGTEALNLQQRGVRLITMHVDEDREYDLSVN